MEIIQILPKIYQSEMKRLSILTCYILFTWLGNCDIVIMDKYLLKVNHMVQKHRFVFAECEKKDAYIEMESNFNPKL